MKKILKCLAVAGLLSSLNAIDLFTLLRQRSFSNCMLKMQNPLVCEKVADKSVCKRQADIIIGRCADKYKDSQICAKIRDEALARCESM